MATSSALAKPRAPLEVIGFSSDGTQLFLDQEEGGDVYLLSSSDGSTRTFRLWNVAPEPCAATMRELTKAVADAHVADITMHPELCAGKRGRFMDRGKAMPGAIWFEADSYPGHHDRDRLRSGSISFKLRDGKLVLREGKRVRLAIDALPAWSSLWMIEALLGPKRHFLLISTRVSDFEWEMAMFFASPDGHLATLQPFTSP